MTPQPGHSTCDQTEMSQVTDDLEQMLLDLLELSGIPGDGHADALRLIARRCEERRQRLLGT